MLQDIFRNKMRAMRGLDAAQVLSVLGLAPRRSSAELIAESAVIFAAGMFVGGCIALLLAPTSGRRMREQLNGKVSDLRETLGAKASEIVDGAVSAVKPTLSVAHDEQDAQNHSTRTRSGTQRSASPSK